MSNTHWIGMHDPNRSSYYVPYRDSCKALSLHYRLCTPNLQKYFFWICVFGSVKALCGLFRDDLLHGHSTTWTIAVMQMVPAEYRKKMEHSTSWIQKYSQNFSAGVKVRWRREILFAHPCCYLPAQSNYFCKQINLTSDDQKLDDFRDQAQHLHDWPTRRFQLVPATPRVIDARDPSAIGLGG
jgi:hypothetical protein